MRVAPMKTFSQRPTERSPDSLLEDCCRLDIQERECMVTPRRIGRIMIDCVVINDRFQ